MPPHVTETYTSLQECEMALYAGDYTHMPGLDFKAVEMEG